jgi:transcriptional regulator with XRE-family HTH domain
MPTTLQDLRKAKFSTIKAFALACGFSTSKASTILQGRHANAISPDEVRHIAKVLGVSFQEFVDAQSASYAEWHEKNVPKPSQEWYEQHFEPTRSKSPIDLIPLTNLRKV